VSEEEGADVAPDDGVERRVRLEVEGRIEGVDGSEGKLATLTSKSVERRRRGWREEVEAGSLVTSESEREVWRRTGRRTGRRRVGSASANDLWRDRDDRWSVQDRDRRGQERREWLEQTGRVLELALFFLVVIVVVGEKESRGEREERRKRRKRRSWGGKLHD
jgi:hypothetical protein